MEASALSASASASSRSFVRRWGPTRSPSPSSSPATFALRAPSSILKLSSSPPPLHLLQALPNGPSSAGAAGDDAPPPFPPSSPDFTLQLQDIAFQVASDPSSTHLNNKDVNSSPPSSSTSSTGLSGSRAGLFRTPISGGVHSATSAHDLPPPALAVRNLMEQARFAHLCTTMSKMHHRRAGYPFGSLVDFAPDSMGRKLPSIFYSLYL